MTQNQNDSLENLAGTVSNAETLKFSKTLNAFEGMIKGSESRKLFDIKLTNSTGSLVATLTETGAGSKGTTHMYPLEPVIAGGGLTKNGGKRPNYSGKDADSSLALWLSDYGPTTVFCIFSDTDHEAVQQADEFWNNAHDDERVEQASTFFEQADMSGDCNRPDQSDEAISEEVAFSKALNG